MITKTNQPTNKKSHQRSYVKEMERLKKEGYKIKVRHNRNFIRPVVTQVVATKNTFEIKFMETLFMTKGEMKKQPYSQECELQNYGGETIVSIFKDDQLVGQGIAHVHKNDHFVRYIGLNIAFGRALKQLSK